jgi:hypothetical protein
MPCPAPCVASGGGMPMTRCATLLATPRCRVARSAGACRRDMGWRSQAPEQAALPAAAGARAAPAERASRKAPLAAAEGRDPATAPPGTSKKAKSRSARQQRARQRQRSGGKGADVEDAAVRSSAAAGAGAAVECPSAKRQRADAGQRSQPAGVDRRAKPPALASGSAKPAGACSPGCASGTGAEAPGRCFRALLAQHAPPPWAHVLCWAPAQGGGSRGRTGTRATSWTRSSKSTRRSSSARRGEAGLLLMASAAQACSGGLSPRRHAFNAHG